MKRKAIEKIPYLTPVSGGIQESRGCKRNTAGSNRADEKGLWQLFSGSR